MSSRRRLLRWASWFAVANAALLATIGLRYLWLYVRLTPSVAWGYVPVAYVGHVTAVAYAPGLLLQMPVILLGPRPRMAVRRGGASGRAGAGLLWLGRLGFAAHRYRLNALTFMLLAPQTWGFRALYVGVGVAIEAMLASWVWQRTAQPPGRRIGRYLAVGLAACFVAGHLVHAWAEARYDVPVVSFTRYLPLYYPLRNAGLLAKVGLVDRNRAREQSLVATLGAGPVGELQYPLAPLRCEPQGPRLNVLLVVIDAMRADALTDASAPRLAAVARGAIQFDRHWSGGKSSRARMFSPFYRLPATYWDAFAQVARSPVLMDLFRRYDYQLGLFASSPVYDGVGLDRTALAGVPDLRLRTGSPYPGSSGKDRGLPEEWYGWLDRRGQARPLFGVLFYHAVGGAEAPPDYPAMAPVPQGASREVRRYSRYLSAVHYVDGLVGQVLDDLERRKLLGSTVVLVTSDHGMEFDESGQGFTGHGTSYSNYQMHTPLVVSWPGRPPGRVTPRTSDNDGAPTLVRVLLR